MHSLPSTRFFLYIYFFSVKGDFILFFLDDKIDKVSKEYQPLKMALSTFVHGICIGKLE